eukprot:gene17218-23541_t
MSSVRVLTGSTSDEIENLIGFDNTVSDQAIKTRSVCRTRGSTSCADSVLAVLCLIIDVILGFILVVIFCFLQRGSILFRFRLYSPSTTYRPPPLPTKGFAAFTSWIFTSLQTSDLELVKSAGLDALVMVKISELGMQLFIPIMLIAVFILCPIHY